MISAFVLEFDVIWRWCRRVIKCHVGAVVLVLWIVAGMLSRHEVVDSIVLLDVQEVVVVVIILQDVDVRCALNVFKSTGRWLRVSKSTALVSMSRQLVVYKGATPAIKRRKWHRIAKIDRKSVV